MRVVKYEAAAGSGKTFRLTAEYLRAVLQRFDRLKTATPAMSGEHRVLASVLAITFTNKAAREMKNRILKYLKQFSLSKDPEDIDPEGREILAILTHDLKIPDHRVIELSRRVCETIINYYHDFNVKTIDSLMSAIIRVVSPDLGLPPRFEVEIGGQEEMVATALQFLEERCRLDWPEMESVLRDIDHAIGLRSWTMENLIADQLATLFSLSLYREIATGVEDLPGEEKFQRSCREFQRRLKVLVDLIQSEGKPVPQMNKRSVDPRLIDNLQRLTVPPLSLTLLEDLMKRAIFTAADSDRLLVKAADEAFCRRFSTLWTDMRRQLSNLVGVASRYRVAHFARFYTAFSDYWSRDRDRVFVSEFPLILRDQFGIWERSALPYVYLKLSDRFRHFLFDEFQDTSDLQFKALAALVTEVLASDDSSSLFLVGDRKQAIYRWRGGDAGLMEEERLKNELPVLTHITGKSFTRNLDVNWRSARWIVDFNNAFWKPQGIEETLSALDVCTDIISALQHNFSAAGQKLPVEEKTPDGWVKIAVSLHDGDADPASLLMDRLVETIQQYEASGYPLHAIAILVRTRDEGRDVVRFLEAAGIPTLTDESLHLASSPLIQEVIAFFRFLDYPPDDLNFYSFISGRIFITAAREISAESLIPLDDWLCSLGNREEPLYSYFRRDFAPLWKRLIDPFFREVGLNPPYDLYQDMIQRYALLDRFRQSVPFLLRFAEILHQLERRDVNSIASFVDHWEKNLAGQAPYNLEIFEDQGKVRVMTMHKAKGLEFPVVITPFRKRSASSVDNIHPGRQGILYLKKAYAGLNEEIRGMYLEELKQLFVDELNLLYVALTRARSGLHVLISGVKRARSESSKRDELKSFPGFAEYLVNHPLLSPENSFFKRMSGSNGWEEMIAGKTARRPPDADEPPEPKPHLSLPPSRLTTGEWQREFLVFRYRSAIDRETAEAIRRGERIHALLEKLGIYSSPEELESEVRQRAADFSFDTAIADRLVDFLQRPDVYPYFSGAGSVQVEMEITGTGSQGRETRRVDRIYFEENRITIIDYKTGMEKNPADEDQVRLYARLVSDLFTGKTLAGRLLYIDADEVVEVPC